MSFLKTKYVVEVIEKGTTLIEDHTVGVPVYCWLLEGEERALLIDTGYGRGNLAGLVRSLTDKPVTVAITHGHFDHALGAGQFGEAYMAPADEPVLKLQKDIRYLSAAARRSTSLPVYLLLAVPIRILLKPRPEAKFLPLTDGQVFDLGNRTVEVIATPGHSVGSCCFLDKKHRMLFTGDTVCAIMVLLNLCGSTSPSVYLHSLEKLKARSSEYDRLMPGHHTRPAGTDLVDRYIACAGQVRSGNLSDLAVSRDAIVIRQGNIQINIPKNPKVLELPAEGELPYLGD